MYPFFIIIIVTPLKVALLQEEISCKLNELTLFYLIYYIINKSTYIVQYYKWKLNRYYFKAPIQCTNLRHDILVTAAKKFDKYFLPGLPF